MPFELRTIFLFVIFIVVPASAVAQRTYSLTDSSAAQVDRYAVLPDRGYTFDKIRTDTTLRFIDGDSLRPLNSSSYWLKLIVVNPRHYAESYNVLIRPILNNTLYYFDANAQKWISRQAGILTTTPIDYSNRVVMPCVLQGQTANTLYIKVDVQALRKSGSVVKPGILLEKQAAVVSRKLIMWVSWVSALLVLFLFLLNNLYIYFSFRDKVVLYYLIGQVGGMIYVTAYKVFFSNLFFKPSFHVQDVPDGQLHFYDMNSILMHVSILLILFGFVQLTRLYLTTKKTLPRLDLALNYGLYTYILLTVILICINVCFVYLENYTLLYHNVLALLLIAMIIYACVVGYVRKLPAATPFLFANILPLGFMLAITLYHVFVDFDYTENSFLPDLAIVSQALAFSIALVARTKSIRKELKVKELETQQLAFDIREIELRQQLTELENQKISADMQHEKTKNELLQQKLEVNQRELASTTLYIVQKNELLARLKTQLLELNRLYPNNKQQELKSIESILQSNLYLDADWEKFKVHFEQVHPDFFEKLYAKHPSLTKYEIRLYAYFHIKLSTKEIAALLNIDPASVRRAKTRLYKKMAIPESAELWNQAN